MEAFCISDGYLTAEMVVMWALKLPDCYSTFLRFLNCYNYFKVTTHREFITTL